MRSTGCLLGLLAGGIFATVLSPFIESTVWFVAALGSLWPYLLGLGALRFALPWIPERYRLPVAGAALVEIALWVVTR